MATWDEVAATKPQYRVLTQTRIDELFRRAMVVDCAGLTMTRDDALAEIRLIVAARRERAR